MLNEESSALRGSSGAKEKTRMTVAIRAATTISIEVSTTPSCCSMDEFHHFVHIVRCSQVLSAWNSPPLYVCVIIIYYKLSDAQSGMSVLVDVVKVKLF